MKRVGIDKFVLDPQSTLWHNRRCLRGVPGVKSIYRAGKLAELVIHRSHLPLVGYEGRALYYSWPKDSKDGVRSLIYHSLRNYQCDAVDFASTRRGAILAHDLGLGKTRMALGASRYPLLVLCPVPALTVWRDEVCRWGLSWQILRGKDADRSRIVPVDVYITTYESAHAWVGFFRALSGGITLGSVCADEAHTLHAARGRHSGLLHSFSALQYLALTATPARNRLRSLHGLLTFVAPRAYGALSEFRIRYCGATKGDHGLEDGEPTHADELAARLSETLIYEPWTSPRVRHLRPPLRPEVIKLPFSKDEIWGMTRSALTRAYDGKPDSNVLAFQTAQKAELGQRKVESLINGSEVLLHLLSQVKDSRTIWWCWHRSVANRLTKFLRSRGIDVDLLTGSSTPTQHERIVADWRTGNRLEPRHLVATMGALATGVSLTTAQNAVFVELSYAPLDIQQAEARHHRPGNEWTLVRSFYLVVPDTIEQRIAEILVEKLHDHSITVGPSAQQPQILALMEALR